MIIRHVLPTLLSLATLSCASMNVAPTFVPDEARLFLMVATSTPGGEYPTPPECLGGDVICFRYPLWFTAESIQAVHGRLPKQASMKVTLYTHYSQPQADSIEKPRLLLMLEDGGHLFAVEHMYSSVVLRSDGSYVLPLFDEEPIFWLPCDIYELKEPITPSDFIGDISVPIVDLSEEYPESTFNVIGGRAYPRYGIPVDAIRAKLTDRHVSLHEFACPVEDES